MIKPLTVALIALIAAAHGAAAQEQACDFEHHCYPYHRGTPAPAPTPAPQHPASVAQAPTQSVCHVVLLRNGDETAFRAVEICILPAAKELEVRRQMDVERGAMADQPWR